MKRNAGEAGFTLTELMIVVAILAVLLAVAITNVNKDPSVRDVAQQASTILREGSRTAVARGPVRDDVVAATGITARSRTRIVTQSGFQHVIVETLVEDAAPLTGAQWERLRFFNVDRSVSIHGVRSSAETVPGLGPETVLGTGEFSINCYPNGSCDATTLYLQKKKGKGQARMVVMPLNGSPLFFEGW